MFQTFSVRAKELLSVSRSVAQWMNKRKIASFIGKTCDNLFGRTSLRLKKNISSLQRLSEEELDVLRQKLKTKRMECREDRIVFFDDAGFGATMKGHNAIPKKKILRELCHRGLTILLDEYNTSKMCPCGSHELVTKAGRFRGHKTDGSFCSYLSLSCDRDFLAVMNMLQCAIRALRGIRRPIHLCRPVKG